MNNACRYCKGKGELVFSDITLDYICQICGEWQEARLGDGFEIIGYKGDK